MKSMNMVYIQALFRLILVFCDTKKTRRKRKKVETFKGFEIEEIGKKITQKKNRKLRKH